METALAVEVKLEVRGPKASRPRGSASSTSPLTSKPPFSNDAWGLLRGAPALTAAGASE
jgi:hypothetical protein